MVGRYNAKMSVSGRCNDTTAWSCLNGNCIHISALCDDNNDCGDGSDESPHHAHCKEPPYRLSPLEVAAIVIGCIIGAVILCCLLGTVIDCFMHVYKYWCSCLHKAYRSKRPTETIALRNPNFNPNCINDEQPTVLVVRAVPPTYSTIVVSCESSTRDNNRVTEDNNSSNDLVCNEFNFDNATQLVLSKNRSGCTILNPYTKSDSTDNVNKQRDICTQTSVERGRESSVATERPTLAVVRVRADGGTRDAVAMPRSQSAHSRINSPNPEKTPTLDGPLPPSYSSIYLGQDQVTYSVTRGGSRNTGALLSPPPR